MLDSNAQSDTISEDSIQASSALDPRLAIGHDRRPDQLIKVLHIQRRGEVVQRLSRESCGVAHVSRSQPHLDLVQ